MDYAKLFKPGEPGFYLTTLNDAQFANLGLYFGIQYKDVAARYIRGKKSKTVTAFFDEVAAALQFPYYFGYNWNAFDECVNDFEWLEGEAYLLLISDAHLLFEEADQEDFRILIKMLVRANQEWLEPNKYIPRHRPSTPFHTIFQCPAKELAAFEERLRLAEADFELLDKVIKVELVPASRS